MTICYFDLLLASLISLLQAFNFSLLSSSDTLGLPKSDRSGNILNI